MASLASRPSAQPADFSLLRSGCRTSVQDDTASPRSATPPAGAFPGRRLRHSRGLDILAAEHSASRRAQRHGTNGPTYAGFSQCAPHPPKQEDPRRAVHIALGFLAPQSNPKHAVDLLFSVWAQKLLIAAYAAIGFSAHFGGEQTPPGGLSGNLAIPAGFEPATCPLGGGCSIQLSHGTDGLPLARAFAVVTLQAEIPRRSGLCL